MKIFIILPILFLYCALASGQNSITPITIDFKDKTVKMPDSKTLHKTKAVYFQIDNISTGVYKISINKKDSVISVGTPPALFGVLSFGDGFNSILSGLTAYNVHNMESMVSTVITNQQSRAPASVLFDKLLGTEEIEKEEDECGEENALDLKMDQDAMRKFVMDFHFQFRDEVIKPADRLNASISIQSDAAPDSARFRNSTEDIINRRLALEIDLEQRFNEYYNNILFNTKYKLIVNCGYLRAADSMLTTYKKGFHSFLNFFDSSFNEAKMVVVYKEITKPKPAQFIKTFPYMLHGDMTTIDIEVAGIDANKTPQNYATSIQLEKYPNKLWAFSTGVYAGGLYNRNYSILTNTSVNSTNPNKTDTLNYSILENAPDNKMEVGINALLHYGKYLKSGDIGVAISFGPGLSLEKNPGPRIMLGGSVVIGRTNKLMLSGGWVGGIVTELSSAYNIGGKYNPVPGDITTDKFRGDWFISLGYAIFGK